MAADDPDVSQKMLDSLNVASIGVGVGRATVSALADLERRRAQGQDMTAQELDNLGKAHGYTIVKERDL